MKINLLVAIVLLLSACARSEGGAGTTATPTATPTTPPPAPIAHPTGADELVFSWSQEGGFMPSSLILSQMPNFAMLGDGTVIMPGAQVMIYPGPLLPSLQARQMTEAGMQELLGTLLDSGAFERPAHLTDGGPIADAGTAVFTLNAAGRQVSVDAYALSEMPEYTPENGDEAELRTALSHVLQTINELEGADVWAESEWRLISPPALRLYVTPAAERDADQMENFRNEHEWPLALAPESFGTPAGFDNYRCGVVAAEELAAVLPQLEQANSETVWVHQGTPYQLIAKPLLHQPFDCSDNSR